MKNNYVIDKVPYNKLSVESQKYYGKVWYCHMKDFPNIPVAGSIGTKRQAQKMCDLYNYKSKKSR
jgi:hypothetical protein